MSAALGLASLVAFCLGLFVLVPMVLIPVALVPLFVQRARRQRTTFVHPAPLALDEPILPALAGMTTVGDITPRRQDYSRAA